MLQAISKICGRFKIQIGGVFGLKKCDPFELKILGCFAANTQVSSDAPFCRLFYFGNAIIAPKKDGAQINSCHFSRQIEATKLFGAMYTILEMTHGDAESGLSTQ